MSVMKSAGRRRVSIAVLSLLAASVSTAALAGGFALREQSTVGQGMSFAGMAAGGGSSISGMFWNPAVVNDVEHYQGESHVAAVLPKSTIDVQGAFAPFGDSGNIGDKALIPAGYNAYRLTDQIAIGLVTGAPFGLSTTPDANWGGQLLARKSEVFSFNATPTVGFKLNDWVSFGAGLQIQYFDIALRRAAAAVPNAPTIKLTGDDVGFGFTAGVNFTPMDGTDIGVGFRSKIKHELDGKVKSPAPNIAVKADLTLPEMVTIGLRQRITPELTLLGGFEWTNWSRLKTVTVTPIGQVLQFNYKDGYFFSGGLEYKATPDITVRSGVAYEKSPINDSVRDVRLPDDDRWWLSVGGSYDYSKAITVDLGYSYVFVRGKSDINNTPLPGFTAEAKTHVHILSAGLRYKFGAEAAPVLVTKD